MSAFKKTVSGVALFALLGSASMASAETFQEALISVYNSNPRLQAERARVREVDENYIQARAQGRLTATASGNYGYTAASTPATDNPFTGSTGGNVSGYPYSAQLQVIQPIYQGGRVKALKKQAKSSILAARKVCVMRSKVFSSPQPMLISMSSEMKRPPEFVVTMFGC